ncbi:TPA: YibE/F family protein, partial [Candidatus Poribacteria bacterium]|nr:YibE/F family protein [Candidatus Poribacteria bacterium]HEX30401.1 YibE/F family protein [Candidatus Poribacteria bacterium]
LIRAGMNVGTDVLGTMSNTLVFAYFGLRLLLVMASLGTKIFAQTGMQLLSVDVISAEVIRILAGSIGMVITIPLTALIAGLWYCRKPKPKF